MQKNEIREALHEYRREKKEEKQLGIIGAFIIIELIIFSIAISKMFDFGFLSFVLLIGGIICYFIPIVGVILCVLISGFWGLIAWWIGWQLNHQTSSLGTVVFGFVVFAISLGIHLYPRYSDASYRNL